MHIVYDTNIVISAVLYGGRPLDALNVSMLGTAAMALTSPVLIDEFATILARKFAIPSAVMTTMVREYESRCELVVPTRIITTLTDDPDNRVLECAIEGGCEYIVTGDKELLALNRFENVRIVSVNDFLQIINE